MTAIKKYKVRKEVVKGGLIRWVRVAEEEEDPSTPLETPASDNASLLEDLEAKTKEISRLEGIVARLSKALQDAKSRSGDYIISDQPFRKSEPESSDIMAIAPVSTYDCYK